MHLPGSLPEPRPTDEDTLFQALRENAMQKRQGWKLAALAGLMFLMTILVSPLTNPAASGIETEASWPRWRGPQDNGVAASDAPLQWDTSKNVKWKKAIPGKGHSTPIIWGDKIFLTTAVPTKEVESPAESAASIEPPPPPVRRSGKRGKGKRGRGRGRHPQIPLVEHSFELICLDKNNGKTLWRKVATVETPHEGFHHRYGSFASNSPVTDGKHVFAFFGSRGMYAYDLAGNLAWKTDLGVKLKMRNAFGEGTAPVLHQNTLVLNADHEGSSFILALDKRTGKELWRTSREERSTWAPPLVVEYGGRAEAIVTGTTRVRSYDLRSGELIWECGGLGTNPVPAPVRYGDTVIVMTGHREPNLLAIRLGRKGDLTDSDAIVWTNQRGNSYTCSPVLHGDQLYMVTDRGMISCLNAKTGEPYYSQQRLPNPYQFKASPIAAKGKLYLASEQGDVIVMKMGGKYQVLRINSMPDHFFIASPIVVGNELFLRSQDTLYCIAEAG